MLASMFNTTNVADTNRPHIPDDPCCFNEDGMKMLIPIIIGVALAILATVVAFAVTNIFSAALISGIAWLGALGSGLFSFFCCCPKNTVPLSPQNRRVDWINPAPSAFERRAEVGHQRNRGTGAPLSPLFPQTIRQPLNSATGAPQFTPAPGFPPQGGLGNRAQVGDQR